MHVTGGNEGVRGDQNLRPPPLQRNLLAPPHGEDVNISKHAYDFIGHLYVCRRMGGASKLTGPCFNLEHTHTRQRNVFSFCVPCVRCRDDLPCFFFFFLLSVEKRPRNSLHAQRAANVQRKTKQFSNACYGCCCC